VAALARTPGSLTPAAGLTVISGQATDRDAVADAVVGADVVLSALGPRGAKTSALLETAAGHIVAAMAKAGTRRLIAVSAAGAFIEGDPDMNTVVKFVVPRVFARQFADVRRMESVITSADLEWTLVRPTRLVSSPGTGRYRVRPDYPPSGGRTIARADVTHFITSVLMDGAWLREYPAIAY
jgi:putative NADH-flavin reductase